MNQSAWINVNDRLPDHSKSVYVKIGNEFGVAMYSKSFGFDADSSAYDISCDDDSGLDVSLNGDVNYWMDIPS
jgi:hypothetical protein